MIDYLYLFLYRSFAFLAKILPRSIMDHLLHTLSAFSYRFSKKYHHIINVNLDLAFSDTLSQKEKDEIGKQTFYNLLQTITGFMRRGSMTKENLLKDVTFENEAVLLDAIKENKKIIFFTAHYSNWEMIPPLVTTKFDLKASVIGRKLDSELMDRILLSHREAYDVAIIYRTGAIKNALKALKENRTVGLLLDQHLGEKQGGVEVDFFGHKAYQSPAASVLGRMSNAAIIPIFISTDDHKKYTLKFYPALPIIKTDDKEKDIAQMCQAQSNVMEDVIRTRPQEWFWVHKRWKGFYPERYNRSKQ